jgi:hypothetical protein
MSVAPSLSNARVREMVRQLDEAMTPRDDAGRCRAVKHVLEETFAAGTEFLDARFLVPNTERYARRLVHRDPDNRYTVIAMVWNVGQGTPLHDQRIGISFQAPADRRPLPTCRQRPSPLLAPAPSPSTPPNRPPANRATPGQLSPAPRVPSHDSPPAASRTPLARLARGPTARSSAPARRPAPTPSPPTAPRAHRPRADPGARGCA